MKLATIKDGSRDGRLVVVSRDLKRATYANGIAPTMQAALDNWDNCEEELQGLANGLEDNKADDFLFFPSACMAPLPRSHQFVDASAFMNHGNIMEQAYNLSVEKTPGIPILIQRQSDDFRGPCDDYLMLNEQEDIDFEGEFAVITGDIAMASTADEAQQKIRLITMINDVSCRAHLNRELRLGFGFINAKPATVFAPVAVTPDELGDDWRDGRIHLNMDIHRSGKWFGSPNGREMDWSFGELLAHLALNRSLGAGTILGSGTVSNHQAEKTGSACLAERRALDVIRFGEPRTEHLRSGERLRFNVFDSEGQSVFGAIDYRTKTIT